MREMTSQRNKSLCDVFYGMSVVERAGTGLSDVVKYAQEESDNAVLGSRRATKSFGPNSSSRAPPDGSRASRGIRVRSAST
jgi:hypothetical protein